MSHPVHVAGLEQGDVLLEQIVALPAPVDAVVLVAIHAKDRHRHAIDKELTVADFDGPEYRPTVGVGRRCRR